MPMDPIYFIVSLLKLVVTTAIPIIIGILTDKTILQNTSFMGVATVAGIITAGIVMMIVLDRISLGLKEHLKEKNNQTQA